MSFNEQLPRWDNSGNEPPESKKNDGWLPEEKPPAQWFNWLFNRIYKVLEEIRNKFTTHEGDNVAHGTATKAEAQVGTSHGSYMTPLRTKEAIQALESVSSVAGKKGAVTVTKGDVGLSNVDNVKQASKTEFDEHLADSTSHGIGNKATLLTTNKSTIVGAMNELFTNVSNGKNLVGGAITDVDDSVIIPTDPTFQNLANAIGQIKTAELAGINWIEQTSSFGTTIINDIIYADGVFVAVGYSGKLATSTNGTTWTQRTSSFDTSNIYGVTYGYGMFVAVGANGKLATSTNGITWTQRTSSFGDTPINDVAYGDGVFVAVGDNGKLATSTNGITWTQRTSSFDTSNINAVAYGQGTFVIVGRNGKLASSINGGSTWTQRDSKLTANIMTVAFGRGCFVIGSGGEEVSVASSNNGSTWTRNPIEFGSGTYIYRINYGQGLFVLGGSRAEAIFTSVTGRGSWIPRTNPVQDDFVRSIYGVAYGQGLFVIGGTRGMMLSSNNVY